MRHSHMKKPNRYKGGLTEQPIYTWDDTDVAFIIADSNASKNTELVTPIVCSCVGVKD